MEGSRMWVGGTFGTATSSDSIASDNAAKAGIVVVAAAGNAGPAPYVTGAPAAATDSISVAAMDARQFVVNGVHIALSSGSGANGVEANSLALPHGSVPAVILTNAGSLSFRCSAADYPAGGAPPAPVVMSRASCSFLA